MSNSSQEQSTDSFGGAFFVFAEDGQDANASCGGIRRVLIYCAAISKPRPEGESHIQITGAKQNIHESDRSPYIKNTPRAEARGDGRNQCGLIRNQGWFCCQKQRSRDRHRDKLPESCEALQFQVMLSSSLLPAREGIDEDDLLRASERNAQSAHPE